MKQQKVCEYLSKGGTMKRQKVCFCIGPENCSDSECELVKEYRRRKKKIGFVQ